MDKALEYIFSFHDEFLELLFKIFTKMDSNLNYTVIHAV